MLNRDRRGTMDSAAQSNASSEGVQKKVGMSVRDLLVS